MQTAGEVVLKRSNSKEEQNVAAGGVLLKRSNSKEEQNVAEAKAQALQASLVNFFESYTKLTQYKKEVVPSGQKSEAKRCAKIG